MTYCAIAALIAAMPKQRTVRRNLQLLLPFVGCDPRLARGDQTKSVNSAVSAAKTEKTRKQNCAKTADTVIGSLQLVTRCTSVDTNA